MCRIQFADYRLQCEKCNVQSDIEQYARVQFADCNIQGAMCRVQCAESNAQSPECMCKVQCEMQRPIHGIQCTKSAMHRIQLPENVESAKRARQADRQRGTDKMNNE